MKIGSTSMLRFQELGGGRWQVNYFRTYFIFKLAFGLVVVLQAGTSVLLNLFGEGGRLS
jgi:hypothetical protein